MEKLGKVLLFILNVFINLFLIMTVFILALWIFFGVTPQQSIQSSFMWLETSWNSLWGYETQERKMQLSPKYQKRAHRQLYVEQPNKRDKSADDIVTQPYKQERR